MEGDAIGIGVATVLFDDEWQVESRNLHARLQLMGEILGAADRHRAALLVLPAGFFVVSRDEDRDEWDRGPATADVRVVWAFRDAALADVARSAAAQMGYGRREPLEGLA